MKVTRNSVETMAGPSDWFTGSVYVDAVATPSGPSRLSASSVHFTPGAHTAWHTHPNGQTIYVLEGGAVDRRLGRPQDVPAKSTSFVATAPASRPGAAWLPQYRFVCVMTLSGGGAPHAVWSSVVWASLTRVASYPLANAPWSVERMQASVWAPTTTSRPTPSPDSTVSRVVSSKESP